MFFSLAQTLVCVLLINGGLYALHLSGNSGSNGNSNGEQQPAHQPQQQLSRDQLSRDQLSQAAANRMLHALQLPHHSPPPPPLPHAGAGHGVGHAHRSAAAAAFDATTGRLNQEIADMAQLERERLMLLGLAKQTAESPAAPAGHHGRPIIAGRVHMQPTEELDVVGDYPALLQQAARGFMFGSVVKQPPAPLPADEDYEELREFGRRPVKYDYGRVVQPEEREEEQQQQQQAAAALYESQHGFGDFDDFMELEAASEHGGNGGGIGEEDLLSDLDNYQYHGWEEEPLPENPYRELEQLDLGAPHGLQQLFEHEREQNDAPAKQQHKMHSNGNGNNNNFDIRMQQKWARKRAQGGSQPQSQSQSQQLQRNIFGQHFKQQRSKLALAKSEAMANKVNNNNNNKATTRSGAAVAKDNEKATSTSQQQQKKPQADAQQQQQSQPQPQQNKKEPEQQQQQQQLSQPQLGHPNHKRSGGGAGASATGYASPPVSHSIASQLMLRTARGQRQYDVPQIECPTAMDGMERFACPTPDLQGRYRCIDDHVLCDGFIDCPEGEDEDRRSCMFYKTTKAHLDVLADALLRWARGR